MKLRKTLAGILGAVVMLLGVGTFEHVNKETGVHAATVWELVTDASTLKSGDQIVIAESSKGFVASNTITGDYMKNETATFSSDKSTITSLPSTAAILTLVGSSSSWTLTNGSNKKLGAKAVKKVAWDNGTTTWSISIASNNATIQNGTSSYGRFLYNVNSPRFTTYTSNTSTSMLLPQIYKAYEDSTVEEHVCSYVEVDTPKEENVFKEATCTEAAWYKKVCSDPNCGLPSTNENDVYKHGNALGHDFDNDLRICSRCSVAENASNSVRTLFETYYNGGNYLKDSVINITDMTVKDVELNFHASASVNERETWYSGENNITNKVHMVTNEDLNKDGVAEIVNSTYFNENGIVSHTGKGGNWSVDWTSVEDRFVTLKDFIETNVNGWTYDKGVFTYNLVKTTCENNIVTENEMTRMAREFVAPMWLEPNKKNYNYVIFNKLTVEDTNNGLVMKLFIDTKTEAGKLNNDDGLFSQITINKIYKISVVDGENYSVNENYDFISENKTLTYSLDIPDGYILADATADNATVTIDKENKTLTVYNAIGNVVVTPVVKVPSSEPVTSTISFADKNDRISYSTSKQEWANEGVTFINNKASSQSDIGDYSNPIRLYKSSNIVIEANAITKIVFNASSNAYATSLSNSAKASLSDATVSVDNLVVTIEFSIPVNSCTINLSDGQTRLNSLSVTYSE